ncbi:RNA-directed DNA polymerase from mobile element jockey-like protein [Pitangus sulphuratus]|nr:RNA-directed DNA polymerase from mobile element jockey-like protein [Pitangus sulphuratus]
MAAVALLSGHTKLRHYGDHGIISAGLKLHIQGSSHPIENGKTESCDVLSIWTEGILKEVSDVIAKPLLMIFEQSWESGEVPADWKLVNIVSIFKKGKKGKPINYRPFSLTSVPGKVMDKIILGGIEKHLKDNAVIGYSQHGFMRGKSCLSNLISFYDKVAHLADEGKPADVIFLGFSKAFDTVSHRILLDKMSSTQLGRHIRWWLTD